PAALAALVLMTVFVGRDGQRAIEIEFVRFTTQRPAVDDRSNSALQSAIPNAGSPAVDGRGPAKTPTPPAGPTDRGAGPASSMVAASDSSRTHDRATAVNARRSARASRTRSDDSLTASR